MNPVFGLGIDHRTLERLYPTLDAEAFAAALDAALDRHAGDLRRIAAATFQGNTFRAEVQRAVEDRSDPVAMGWTWVVRENHPQRAEIARILAPLARHRGMADPGAPLELAANEDWQAWLTKRYFGQQVTRGKTPHYVLVVGGPEEIPFHLQAVLDSAASVGRVAFDNLDDLDAYVQKVLRLETGREPIVRREAVVFAPDGGPTDPTYYSRRFMAEPLARDIKAAGFDCEGLLGTDATKQALLAQLHQKAPAIVYTASHGMAAPGEGLDVQRKVTGAICCQRAPGQRLEEWLLTADDVPARDPFLEGAVFFQFACFGYGTPAVSDFTHWLRGTPGMPERIAERDLVSALPKRLLANPRGPIGFVGHLDTAWLHGFADPEHPAAANPWSERIAPFKSAVERLLGTHAAGVAVAGFNERYATTNALLTLFLDMRQSGQIQPTPDKLAYLADQFIFRSDAQNYMFFGDPAVHLRIPQ